MAGLNIAPASVLLSPGTSAVFHASDDQGNPVGVSWSLNMQVGTLLPTPPASGSAVGSPPSSPREPAGSTSATYIAPQFITPQTIVVMATSATNAASATVTLTMAAITVVPAHADLKAGQEQQFAAIVGAAADASDPVQWMLNPNVGKLDATGLYAAPPEFTDAQVVTVTATRPGLGKQGSATVNLAPPAWKGFGVNVLGAYLLLVFCVVYLMILLWPPTVLTPEAAKAARLDAQLALQSQEDALQKAAAQVPAPTTPPANDAKTEAAKTAYAQAQDNVTAAKSDLAKARDAEGTANSANITLKRFGTISREVDLILLVLLAGFLGSFLHIGQSFANFVGNRTIKQSWSWWYTMQPFIGAGLAVLFYAALRGGVMTATMSTTTKSTDLNAFGLVAISGIVGMFSKAATMKLGELFDTLFKTEAANQQKDKLNTGAQTQTSSQQAGGTATGATGSAQSKP